MERIPINTGIIGYNSTLLLVVHTLYKCRLSENM